MRDSISPSLLGPGFTLCSPGTLTTFATTGSLPRFDLISSKLSHSRARPVRLAGSTRLANLDRANKRVEIGWTWYGAEFQRTGVNTECKVLLLTHAFERMDMNRVEWKTDALNTRSRRAILRLGAKEEGTFRHHMVAWNGRLRDTVYFSMLREEWPEAKARLEDRLDA